MTDVFSICFNRPDLIALQAKAFGRFFRAPYRLVVVNNATDPGVQDDIGRTAADLKLPHLRTDTVTDDDRAGASHQRCLRVLLDQHVDRTADLAFLLDGDYFPVADFDPVAYLDGYDLAGVKQRRQAYGFLTANFLLLRPNRLPDLDRFDVEGKFIGDAALDSGGGLYYYLRDHPGVRVRGVPHTWHVNAANRNLHVLPPEVRGAYEEGFDVELYDSTFLHFCRGSNWDHKDANYLRRKTAWVTDYVEGAIAGRVVTRPSGFMMVNEYFGW